MNKQVLITLGLFITQFGMAQLSDTLKTDIPLITPSKSDTLKTDIPLITPSKKIPLPLLRDGDTTSKVEEEPFFDYKSKIPDIQSQIDSLKIIMKLYEKTREMPTIKEELLDLIKVPNRLHRITLHNGTIILGEIVEERIDKIVLKTNIGLLVLDQETIMMIEEELPAAAVVEFIEEPQVEIFSGKEVITGSVTNTGKKRGDFIRVIANLWTKTTELAAKDSAFINGIKMTYNTGVRTDTALEPDQTARSGSRCLSQIHLKFNIELLTSAGKNNKIVDIQSAHFRRDMNYVWV